MLTTCTECGTRFRLTAQQLRQAEGQVRCSRCGEVFDAFVHLRGDDGTSWSLPQDEPTPQADTEAGVFGHDASPSEAETSLGETDDLEVVSGGRAEPRMDDLFASLEADQEYAVDSPDNFDAQTDADDPAAGEPGDEDDSAADGETDPDAESGTRPAHRELPPADHLPGHAAPARHRRWWTLGVVLLALLLGGQWVNANRVALSRNLVIGSSLSAIYAMLGHPLPTPADLNGWQITNTNVTSDPNQAGGLSITGSLANTASFSQSWPLLRVELTNRYGDIMQVRDFLPNEYLPEAEVTSLPAPGSATHFRIDVVDPGPDAVGFKIAACMDVPAGRVCASNREPD